VCFLFDFCCVCRVLMLQILQLRTSYYLFCCICNVDYTVIYFIPFSHLSLPPGTFLTKAQKDAQKKNELRLQSLRDAGYTVPVIKEAVVGAEKEKSGSMVKGGKNGKKVVEKKVEEEEEEDEEKVCICFVVCCFECFFGVFCCV
jgi:hypothetical protein